MTDLEIVSHLTNSYTVAIKCGMARTGNESWHYAEIAEALHNTLVAILSGASATDSLNDLGAEFRADADLIPDERLATLRRRWAERFDALAGVTR